MKKKVITLISAVCVVAVVTVTSAIIFNRPDNDDGTSGTTVSDLLASWSSITDGPQADDITDVENIESNKNSANVTMELGQIAKQGKYIYFLNSGKVIEYDIDTGVAIELNSSNTVMFSMTASDNYIYFAPMGGGGVNRIAKDSNTVEIVFKSDCNRDVYIEGNNAFYYKYGKALYHRDIISDTETLLVEGHVKTFFIDENNIYVILQHNESGTDSFTLMKSPRDNIEFTKVPLSFSPIAVFAHGDDLYLSKMGQWEVVKVSDGVETELPIKSLSYQVVGNKLIYSDTFGKLKIYDLTTAETATIYEGKSTGLYVLDARYVCYTAFGVDWYKLYDLETGETKLIYGEE